MATVNCKTETNAGSRGKWSSAADVQGMEDADHLRCGLGRCSPNCLQKCHNVNCLLVNLCVMVLLQGIIINGLVSSSVTTLEKRFNISSTGIGVLVAMYDIGVLVVLIPSSYLGGKGHKGRWLGVATVLMGIGSLLFALPQFLIEKYTYSNERESLCERGTNDTDPCRTVDDSGSGMYYIFVLAQLIAGFGGASMFTLTFVYLDDNSSKGKSAVLTGIYYGVAIAGSAVGFILNGILLDIYGDFYRVDEVTLDPDDPQWYGAWWMGFLIAGVLVLITSLPLFAFARQLPGTEKYRRKSADRTTPLTETGCKELFVCLKLLVGNQAYVFLVLADSIDSFTLLGLATFLAKLIEKLFYTTAGEAAIYSGIAVVPSGMLGNFLGGFIIKKFKLSTLWIIRFAAIVSFISVPLTFIGLLGCEQLTVVGSDDVNADSKLDPTLLSNISICNSDCECWNKMYDPVCDPSGDFQFLSPCHAGCAVALSEDEYSECACVSNHSHASYTLSSGICEGKCGRLWPFLGLIFLLSCVAFMAATPNIQGILRCVEPELRSLATGVGWILVRCLGTIPGPIAFGALIDTACRLWTEDCGEGKNCLVYDHDKLMLYSTLILVGARLSSSVCMLVASCFYKPGPWDEQEMDEKEARKAASSGSGLGVDNPAAAAAAAFEENSTRL